MSVPVHYDVEAAIANFRAASSNFQLDAGAPAYAHVQKRHGDISIAILRMVLEERNRGTDASDVLYAMSGLACEFLVNFTDQMPNTLRAGTFNLFASQLADAFSAYLIDPSQFALGDTAELPSTSGGHA